MEEKYLTVKELAGLKGCSERNIQLLIESQKLPAEIIKPDIQSPGRGGRQYRIPLSSLDDRLQIKYKRLERKKAKASAMSSDPGPNNDPEPPIDINDLTQSERDEIVFWKQLLKEWRVYRHQSVLSKREADEEFIALCIENHPDLQLSPQILYRKQQLLNKFGEAFLIDKRGKHKNHTRKITPAIWDIFEYFYLDESRLSIKTCRDLVDMEIEKSGLDTGPLPSLATFTRAANAIPEPYILYFREGEKVFRDKCEPYIKRMYEDLEPNDIWVADNHTFDVMVYDGEKPIRLYLTAFMDVRTRKITGYLVTERICGDATICALRKGIENYGIPGRIYADNGREFTFNDFGGSGFRKKSADGAEQPTILKDLGIEFRTALPRNARAKGIERAFNTVKDTFSKLFDAYTGGNILERPGRLKAVVKNPDRMKKVKEFTEFVDTYIRGIYNKQPHSGDGMYGKSPDEMFSALLTEQRRATPEQLELMLMRWSRPMQVGKNGITLKFYGKKLQFSNEYLWANYFGKKVYVRYSPDDLSEIRVYDMDEKFICTASLLTELSYKANKEEVAKESSKRRSMIKAVSGYLSNKNTDYSDALELMNYAATANLNEIEDINPSIIRPLFDKHVKDKAAGDEFNTIFDWTDILDNYGKHDEQED